MWVARIARIAQLVLACVVLDLASSRVRSSIVKGCYHRDRGEADHSVGVEGNKERDDLIKLNRRNICGGLNIYRPVFPYHGAQPPAAGIKRSLLLTLASSFVLIGIMYGKKGRPGPGEGFKVNFIMQDGEEISVQAHEGESLLDVAWANDIDIEGADQKERQSPCSGGHSTFHSIHS